MEKHFKQYGEIDAKDYIPGTEVLLRKEAEGDEVSASAFVIQIGVELLVAHCALKNEIVVILRKRESLWDSLLLKRE